MKTRFIKSLLAMVLTMLALPMIGQDFMNVYFKDGTFRTFHMDNIKEFKISRLDADGILHSDYDYQHIETLWEKFVYALSEIDSISFTKYSKQHVVDNLKEAMPTIFLELSNCETAAEAEDKLMAIRQSESVENAWIENDVLYVKLYGWQTMKFYFDQSVNLSDESIGNTIRNIDIPNGARKVNNPDGVRLKAIVANQQHHDNSIWRELQRSMYMYKLRDKLNEAGYEAEYLDNPDLDFFYNDFFNYDVIFLSTHGNYSRQDGHSFLTSLSFGEIPVNSTQKEIDAFVDRMEEQFEKVFTDPKYKFSMDDIELSYAKETRYINGTEVKYYVAFAGIKESFFTIVR